MKKLFVLAVLTIFFSSCDPVSDMEANIENLTTQMLTIDFVSSDVLFDKTLTIEPNQIALFQEGGGIGDSYIEPSFIEYDSIVIKNLAEDILKIYKVTDSGKNIYNIEDWLLSEPSKRFFKFKYEIDSNDIQ